MKATLLADAELEAVRKQFPSLALPRRLTIALLRKLGFTKWKARCLIEGQNAALPPLPNRTPKQWSREVIIDQFNRL
jgi:hypothetical protein